VFVNTSKAEGLPNTFTQSWARKTPVVSLAVEADNALAVRDIGYPPTDFDSMVENVRTLIENPELRHQYGENAYQYARNNHDIDVVGDRMIEYIENEIQPGRS
jgi:glycosyltransferase involved in cell wall biosynthesis